MSIIIKDETANAVVLTIDNNGNMAFGDGTPINRLTLDGYGIIDSNGYIIHGVTSSSVEAQAGSVNVGVHQQAQITTLAGRTPLVQLDTTYPAYDYFEDLRDPNDPNAGGTESVLPLYGTAVHTCAPQVGSFTIFNNNEADQYVGDPDSVYYDGNLAYAPCGYRWL